MDEELKPKRKRVSKACDNCHVKRIKCIEGGEGVCCRNCTLRKIECTYAKPSNKRGPPVGAKKSKKVLEPDFSAAAGQPLLSLDSRIEELRWSVKPPCSDQKSSSSDGRSSCGIPMSELICSNRDVSAFPSIEVEPGVYHFWLKVYFENVHCKYPMLPENWTLQNVALYPASLSHIMYAMALREGGMPSSYSAADHFYYEARRFYEQDLSNLSGLAAFSAILLSCYSVLFTDQVATGMELQKKAISICEQLGVYGFCEVCWISPGGKLIVWPRSFSDRFCQLVAFVTYEGDMQISFLRKSHYVLPTSQRPDLFQPVFDHSKEVYNDYYSSFSWCWYSQLIYIARRVILSVMHLYPEDCDSVEIHSRALASWVDSLPEWMLKKTTSGFSFDPLSQNPPPWNVAYLLAFFHTTRLLLLKETFLTCCQTGAAPNKYFLQCLESASAIQSISQDILTYNPKFKGIASFFYYVSFLAGAFQCLAGVVKGTDSQELERGIQTSFKVLAFYAEQSPVIKRRIQTISDWRLDPSYGCQEFKNFI
ncbi:hypothetical protein HDV03_003597 [Kappamyces sp. JEL0829]|nr:hypothetical protein HDV03_003597 [Kappamyces sp. JEL0829]